MKFIILSLALTACGDEGCWQFSEAKYNEYYTFCSEKLKEDSTRCKEKARYAAYEDTCQR